MRIKDVMERKVVVITPTTGFKQIVETLLAHDVSGLPVIDDEGHVVGIVTEGDLISKEAYMSQPRRRLLDVVAGVLSGREAVWIRKSVGLTAAEVMTTDLVTCTPETSVTDAARRMLERNVKRLPVVDDDGRLVGIITRHDLLRIFHRSDTEIAGRVREVLARCFFVPPIHDIRVRVTEGVVELEGTTQRVGDVRVAGAIVAAVEGVVFVDNRLVGRESDPAGVRS